MKAALRPAPARPGLGVVVASSLSLLAVLFSLSCGQKPASIRVSPPKSIVYGLKKSTVIAAEILDKKGAVIAGPVVSWESSKPKVASVDKDGRVQSLTAGRTIVKATFGELSGVSSLEVIDAATITITPMRVAVAGPKGTTLRLVSLVKDMKGAPVVVKPKWTSSDVKIATVDADGVVTSVAEGRAVLNASIGDIGTGADVRVTFKSVATFEAAPPTMILKVGDVQQINGLARDESGAPIQDAAVDWISSDPKTVTCIGGEVKGIAAGTATVRATCGGKSSEVSVLVN
ncbi:MAG: Ig-like domain-containing protein [Thermoanaerobaculia bacterium]